MRRWSARRSKRRSLTARLPRTAPHFPTELYTNAGKYHGAANYSLMVRHLHDIGGGSIYRALGLGSRERGDRRAAA